MGVEGVGLGSTMKELIALSAAIATVLMMRAGAISSCWDVVMTSIHVTAFALATWLCFQLHTHYLIASESVQPNEAQHANPRAARSFLGSGFSYLFIVISLVYVLYANGESHTTQLHHLSDPSTRLASVSN